MPPLPETTLHVVVCRIKWAGITSYHKFLDIGLDLIFCYDRIIPNITFHMRSLMFDKILPNGKGQLVEFICYMFCKLGSQRMFARKDLKGEIHG